VGEGGHTGRLREEGKKADETRGERGGEREAQREK